MSDKFPILTFLLGPMLVTLNIAMYFYSRDFLKGQGHFILFEGSSQIWVRKSNNITLVLIDHCDGVVTVVC